MGPPRSSVDAPPGTTKRPLQGRGGAASRPAEPDPRRPLDEDVQRHLLHLQVERRLAARTLALYADALARLAAELQKGGIALMIARANRPLREKLEKITNQGHLEGLAYYPSVHAAIEACQREAGATESERPSA